MKQRRKLSSSKSPSRRTGAGDGSLKERGERQHEGVVTANRAGFGFVKVEGLEADVFLPPGQMRGVSHGDRVRVSVVEDRSGRLSGRLERVLARGTTAFLASIEIQGRSAYATSVDRRLSLRCAVAANDLGGAHHGDWVIAAITSYGTEGALAKARVSKRLDPSRPVELGTEAAIARYDLPVDFPPEAQAEADAYGAMVDSAETSRRVDLRQLPLVTIDGADAKDFDDAVFAEANANGFRLIVAIADVSYYVRPGTALDANARERGTSVYFPSRVLPMLPEALSNRLCSLQPDVDRLCFVADMQVSRAGKLGDARFYPAVMRSAARLTYDQAFAALFEREIGARTSLGSIVGQLEPLVDIYKALVKARHRRGALDFDAPEAQLDIDKHGQIAAIVLHSRNDAHKLIEECMILANVAVARELENRQIGTLYRVHGEPEERKLDLLLGALTALGIAAEIPAENIKPRDLRVITERLGSSPERPFIESLVIRSMQQAVYQPTNIGHFGLALEQYAHFTSPIRRYPDLVVHRTLRAMLAPKDPNGVRLDGERLSIMGADLSRLEKRSDEADRYVESFLKCVYLRDRIGQTFEGLVTTVVEFGCFVQLIGLGIDGLLHTDALLHGDFALQEQGRAWVSADGKQRLGIGVRVHVVVTGANPVEGQVDLQLDTTVAQPVAPSRPSRPQSKPREQTGGQRARGKRQPDRAQGGKSHPARSHSGKSSRGSSGRRGKPGK
ncbi:MAG: ribonuclease R [Steroidobacteraceae bacterium]